MQMKFHLSGGGLKIFGFGAAGYVGEVTTFPPRQRYGFTSYGGDAIVGVICDTDLFDVPKDLEGEFRNLSNRGVRIFVHDAVIGKADADVEVWIYNSSGKPKKLRTRVGCVGFVPKKIEVDGTLKKKYP